MGVVWRSSMMYPTKKLFINRLQTFYQMNAQTELLADAGFFFMGKCITCFYCGGRLGNWKHYNNPWSVHASWFPHCPYILLSKGEEFIRNSKLKMKSRQKSRSLNDLSKVTPRKNCWICAHEEIGVAFLPCGHVVTCFKCASVFEKCPMCRLEIHGFLRVYTC